MLERKHWRHDRTTSSHHGKRSRTDRMAVLLTAAEIDQLGGVDRHSRSAAVVRGAAVPASAEVVRLRGAS